MNSLYTSIVFISSIALLATISGAASNYLLPRNKRKLFVLMFAMLICLNWAEWIGVYFNGRYPEFTAAHKAAKFFELTLTPFMPPVCVKLINSRRPLWIYMPPLFNVVLQVISLFNGMVFSIDAANVYHRGAWYGVYMATFVIGAVLLLLSCIGFEHKCQNTGLSFLIMLMLLIGVSIALPIIAPDFKLDWTCISFTALIYYVYFSQLFLRIDITTTLLNRRYFEHEILKMVDGSAVIFFDVDKFKDINDNYGHDYGDYVLRYIGKTMKKAFAKNGFCYRYGGDEMCVIMRNNSNAVEKSMAEFEEMIQKLRYTDYRFPDVSMGYAYFDKSSETPEDCLKRADVMMYKNKAEKN